MMRSLCVLCLLVVACGPSVANPVGGDTGGSTGSSTAEPGSGGPTSSIPSSTSGGSTTTTGTADASSSSGDPSTSSSSSSSSGGVPRGIVELEGPIHYCADCFNATSYLRPCSDERAWLCLVGEDDAVWRCNGAYAHIRGEYIPNPNAGALDEPCGDYLFEVAEVLDARVCEPSDCGVGCAEEQGCEVECYGPETCPRGEKCVPWAPPGQPYTGPRCSPVVARPGAPGDACQNDPDAPWEDDCDSTSVCVGETCRELCGAFGEDFDCGVDSCFGTGEIQVCMPACNPLASDCAEGEVCTASGNRFACLPEDVEPLFDLFECPSGACEPTQVCVNEGIVPPCGADGCCAELCSLSAPGCAEGLECTDGLNVQGIEDLGVCTLPQG